MKQTAIAAFTDWIEAELAAGVEPAALFADLSQALAGVM